MMNLASGLVGAISAALAFDGSNPRDPAIAKILGLDAKTKSGANVNHQTVMGLPAVMRAVNIVSNGVAKVPFYVFKHSGEAKTWDRSHPSWRVVTRKPHPEINDYIFRQTMTAWAMTWGNAVALKVAPSWPNNGPMKLIPFLPDRTQCIRVTGKMAESLNVQDVSEGALYYRTRFGDRHYSYPADQCVHIRGLGGNPYWGYDIVEVLREAFGGPIAAAEFGNRFFGQGANPNGFIEMPGAMDEEAEENFRISIKRGAEGMGNAHRLMVLEEGAKFHPWTVDPSKAQFLEGKQFDVRLLAMAIGIKTHKLIDSANSSFSSLEQANQEHKEDDLQPWLRRWAIEYSDKLLTDEQSDSGSHSIDIDDEYLEWSPFADRSKGVVELYNNGLIDKEEGRRRVNFGPSKSQYGTRYRKPINIGWEDEQVISGSPIPQPMDDDDDDDQEEDDSAQWKSEAAELRRAWMEKVARRLGKIAMTKASKKDGGAEFVAWVDSLDSESAPAVIQSDVAELYAGFRARMNDIANTASADALSADVAAEVEDWLKNFEEPSHV